MSRVLVTGATGYIGGRLVPALVEAGHDVRCLVRTPGKLDAVPWRGDVDVVRGDVTDPSSLARASEAMDVAYYLVHSIGAGADWRSEDAAAAAVFRDAAAAAGVRQIVYLGGLGSADDELSPHLASRHEVGRILAEGPVPVTELRAAVIIGSGSASFEMLRHLVEVLPVMVTPRWVHTRCQPLAVRDVLRYLVGVLEHPDALGRTLEIGGPDVLTYLDMMRVYAEVAGLPRRRVVPVPVLTPRLSSLWVGLVTPLPPDLARPLIDSLVNEVVVTDPAIDEIVALATTPFRTAVELAVRRVRDLDVTTTWSGADHRRTPADPLPTDPGWAGGTVYTDERTVEASARPEDLFAAVSGIGGRRGWHSSDLLWSLRGLIDLALGGVGRRRGRRHPDELRVGDTVDFWRVEQLDPGRLLRLRAEMRLPGEAWLEWRVEPAEGGSRLVQRARFHPRGLLGRLYWWAMVPAHALIFGRMARGIADAALGPAPP